MASPSICCWCYLNYHKKVAQVVVKSNRSYHKGG